MTATKYIYKVFLEHLSYGMIIPIIVVWQLSKGLSLSEVGLIQAVVMFATFILEVPTGIVADKFGRKTSVIAGTFAHIESLLLVSVGNSFGVFLVSSIAAGFGWSLISGAGEALVFDSLKENNLESKFKHFMSYTTIADESSSLIGMIISSIIIVIFNIQFVLYSATVVMIITFIYAIIALQETRPGNEIISEKIQKKPEPNMQRITNFLGKHKEYISIMIIFAVLYESARVLWQPQLLSLGLKPEQLGIVFAGFKMFSILGSIAARKIKTTRKSFMYLGCISASIFFLWERHRYL